MQGHCCKLHEPQCIMWKKVYKVSLALFSHTFYPFWLIYWSISMILPEFFRLHRRQHVFTVVYFFLIFLVQQIQSESLSASSFFVWFWYFSLFVIFICFFWYLYRARQTRVPGEIGEPTTLQILYMDSPGPWLIPCTALWDRPVKLRVNVMLFGTDLLILLLEASNSCVLELSMFFFQASLDLNDNLHTFI